MENYPVPEPGSIERMYVNFYSYEGEVRVETGDFIV